MVQTPSFSCPVLQTMDGEEGSKETAIIHSSHNLLNGSRLAVECQIMSRVRGVRSESCFPIQDDVVAKKEKKEKKSKAQGRSTLNENGAPAKSKGQAAHAHVVVK